MQRGAAVVDTEGMTHAQPREGTRSIQTAHLIAGPDGWWETYDPLVEAWEATLGSSTPRAAMAARCAAYILLDAPLLRRRRARPDPTRPVDRWEGLDASEVLAHSDLRRVPREMRPTVLRHIAGFLDYLGAHGAIPADVWKSVRREYDACADRCRAAMLEDDPWFPAHQVPERRAPKHGRNQPCPCGSGTKYKRCCGSNGGRSLSL